MSAEESAILILKMEINRLKRGDFTAEEIHDICHNLHGTVDARAFANGCTEEQRKLYGCAPHADAITTALNIARLYIANNGFHDRYGPVYMRRIVDSLQAGKTEL